MYETSRPLFNAISPFAALRALSALLPRLTSCASLAVASPPSPHSPAHPPPSHPSLLAFSLLPAWIDLMTVIGSSMAWL